MRSASASETGVMLGAVAGAVGALFSCASASCPENPVASTGLRSSLPPSLGFAPCPNVGAGTRLAGLAPSKPMIPGSRWCSCGIALKRWVTILAPLRTARAAVSALATLCPMLTRTPLDRTSLRRASRAPGSSGASVTIRTPGTLEEVGEELASAQSSAWASARGP